MEKANKLGNLQQKPTLKYKDIKIDQSYQLYDIKTVNTKFGRNILIELDKGVLFLPKRFQSLTEEDLEKMKSTPMGFIYRGTNEIGKYCYHKIEFINIV